MEDVKLLNFFKSVCAKWCENGVKLIQIFEEEGAGFGSHEIVRAFDIYGNMLSCEMFNNGNLFFEAVGAGQSLYKRKS